MDFSPKWSFFCECNSVGIGQNILNELSLERSIFADVVAYQFINLRGLDPVFFGGYHPTLKLSGIPTYTFIVSLTHRMDNI